MTPHVIFSFIAFFLLGYISICTLESTCPAPKAILHSNSNGHPPSASLMEIMTVVTILTSARWRPYSLPLYSMSFRAVSFLYPPGQSSTLKPEYKAQVLDNSADAQVGSALFTDILQDVCPASAWISPLGPRSQHHGAALNVPWAPAP